MFAYLTVYPSIYPIEYPIESQKQNHEKIPEKSHEYYKTFTRSIRCNSPLAVEGRACPWSAAHGVPFPSSRHLFEDRCIKWGIQGSTTGVILIDCDPKNGDLLGFHDIP